MSEQISHNERSKMSKEKSEHYVLRKKTPKRFLELFLSELVLSLLLYVFINVGIISIYWYCAWVWGAVLIFWIFTWKTAQRNENHTHRKEYYSCNLLAFSLFMLVACAVYLLNRCLGKERLVDTIYFICFRLSYVLALSFDRSVDSGETIPSFIFFYGITLGILSVMPFWGKLRRKWKSKRRRTQTRIKTRAQAKAQENARTKTRKRKTIHRHHLSISGRNHHGT